MPKVMTVRPHAKQEAFHLEDVRLASQCGLICAAVTFGQRRRRRTIASLARSLLCFHERLAPTAPIRLVHESAGGAGVDAH